MGADQKIYYNNITVMLWYGRTAGLSGSIRKRKGTQKKVLEDGGCALQRFLERCSKCKHSFLDFYITEKLFSGNF